MRQRFNPLREVPASDLEAAIDGVARRFGAAWLESSDAHPLQRLWQRTDVLSTMELFTLGQACHAFEAHPRWLDHQVRLIQSGNLENVRGAVFEVMGLAMYQTNGQVVVPAAIDAKAVDGAVRCGDNRELALSLKSYRSLHEIAFQDRSERFRANLLGAARTAAKTAIDVTAWAVKEYPTPDDWMLLDGSADQIVTLRSGQWAFGGRWLVDVRQPIGELDKSEMSNVVRVLAPFHSNEHDNLWAKLADAYLALSSANLPDEVARGIFVHLPPSASIASCLAWAAEWFEQRPSHDVSFVGLLQPAVVRHPDNRSQIIYALRAFINRPHARWLEHARPSLVVPVGAPAIVSAHQVLQVAEKHVPLDGLYVYQRGDLYLSARSDGEGRQSGRAGSAAPGVRTHTVMSMPGGKFVVRSKLTPEMEELLLI